MPLHITQIDGQPVAIVDSDAEYRHAVEDLGIPTIWADDIDHWYLWMPPSDDHIDGAVLLALIMDQDERREEGDPPDGT